VVRPDPIHPEGLTAVATYTYGNDPNHFVEVPDPDRANQTIRPAPGLAVQVRDHNTMAALPDIVTGGYGYVAFTSTASSVRVSTDAFATFKVLRGQEALDAALSAGVDATQAATDAGTALTKVNALDSRVATLEAGGGTTGGGTTFSGTVDWNTQVLNKPTLTANALGALPASARATPNGVVPTDGNNLAPIGFLPVGTAATQVAAGSHVHSTSWASMPAGATVRVFETSPGQYPAPPTTRADIGRIFYGSIRPTTAQGLQANDEWRNTGAA
jgi:hypothetical protein